MSIVKFASGAAIGLSLLATPAFADHHKGKGKMKAMDKKERAMERREDAMDEAMDRRENRMDTIEDQILDRDDAMDARMERREERLEERLDERLDRRGDREELLEERADMRERMLEERMERREDRTNYGDPALRDTMREDRRDMRDIRIMRDGTSTERALPARAIQNSQRINTIACPAGTTAQPNGTCLVTGDFRF